MTLLKSFKKTAALILVVSCGPTFSLAQQRKPLGPLPGTGAQLDFETIKNCLLPDGKQNELLSKAGLKSRQDYAKENLGKYNSQCDHRKLMQEGVSIHALHTYYQDLKVEAADAAMKAAPVTKARLIEHFAFDGTCFYKDMVTAQADENRAWSDCRARLNRYAADAALEARENMLLYNDTRDKLMSGKSAIAFQQVGTKSVPDISSTRIVKDIRKYGKLSDEQKKARFQALTQKGSQNPQQMLARTQSVEFVPGAATADAVKKAGKDLYGSKSENLSDKTFNADDVQNDKTIEVTDQSKQASFAKGLASPQQASISQKLTQQQQRDRKDLEQTMEMRANGTIKPLPPSVIPLVSEAALEKLVDEVIKSANKDKKELADKAGKGNTFKSSDSNADTYDVTKPIGKASSKRTPGSPQSSKAGNSTSTSAQEDMSIDAQLEKKLPDVIDSIRKDVPSP